ncbi:hypothetical protein BDP27DRAFT_1404788 [Rhodocollybia butyracea]|uniref:polynucleotide adenylyltransferase n=1 Tax=Rhodocollybia butyracea TaxID=206335 RepID=A0A9P5U3Z9_9AGAR|nr:hypothetical protein BDP27DRAFT_1404788 [Rhodocollybia butyracea]
MVAESAASTAGPSSRPSGHNSKPRIKRKRSNVETSEPSSSTSTPRPSRNNDQRPKPRRKKEKRKDKTKDRLKEDADAQPISNGNNHSMSFESAADFIALLNSSDDDESPFLLPQSDKGKEKELDENSKPGRRNGRKRSRSRSSDDRDGDRNRDRDRKNDRDRGKDRGRTPEREWDRGKHRDRRRYDQPVSASVRPIGNRKLPWLEDLDLFGCLNVAELLHKEVEAFTKWISPSPVEDEIRSLLVERIQTAISSRFPDAKILPFGSYATKLYLPTGDIDLVVMSETMRNADKHLILRSLADIVKRNGIASNVSIIAKARVPIIKFVTTHGHIPVDISINQGNGAVGADVVNGFLRNMYTSTNSINTNLEGSAALRALVMITKMFLSQRSMNEVYTGGLGSYSIVCLVISFLQMHPKIRRAEMDADKNLGVLLIEFFELYGSYFNYENVGISVRDGGTYFNKRQRGWYNDNSNYRGKGGASTLSIEDPIDISNDISSGSYGFPKVRATFAGAHKILTATAYLKAGILSARQSGRWTSLRPDDAYRPEEMSILSHIIDVTQDWSRKSYDQRTLHDILHVKPRPIVVKEKPSLAKRLSSTPNGRHKPVSNKHRVHEEPTSKEANGADLEDGEIHIISSDSEDDSRHHKRRHESNLPDSDDDSGKYGITERQPPKKRQRMGGPMDVHTVFTTDDDISFNSASEDGETDSLAAEEEDYDVGSGEMNMDNVEGTAETKAPPSSDKNQRRSYWLSKGIGADVEDEDQDTVDIG